MCKDCTNDFQVNPMLQEELYYEAVLAKQTKDTQGERLLSVPGSVLIQTSLVKSTDKLHCENKFSYQNKYAE